MKKVFKRLLLIGIYIIISPLLLIALVNYIRTGDFTWDCPDSLLPFFRKLDIFLNDK